MVRSREALFVIRGSHVSWFFVFQMIPVASSIGEAWHELKGSMLTHWSESRYHGCMLLVFPNDSAHSFSWRGMDVNPVEAVSMHVLSAFSLASHCEVRGSEAELALCY